MSQPVDVAVVGAGIAGLAHSWMAARRGLRVLLLDRSVAARGASVRNFGMIWPVGQPAGEFHAVAMRARELWLELGRRGVVPVEECGSVHLAHHPDELPVLEEFAAQQTHDARMLTAAEVFDHTPLANPDGLLAGLWSPTELRVDPRTASREIAAWLATTHQVECSFETPVVSVEDGQVHAADGRSWRAERTIICSGSDLRTLFPRSFRESGLQHCKLQMLKIAGPPPAAGAAHVASGLTLRHYTAFGNCRSLAALRNRVAKETPELDRFGIHVMASQYPNGAIVLGDSHEYGPDITPFDNAEIDRLILRELRRVITLPEWRVRERWHGVYAKHPTAPVFEFDVTPNVHVFTGLGGSGMTMAFGLADRSWKRWMGEADG